MHSLILIFALAALVTGCSKSDDEKPTMKNDIRQTGDAFVEYEDIQSRGTHR